MEQEETDQQHPLVLVIKVARVLPDQIKMIQEAMREEPSPAGGSMRRPSQRRAGKDGGRSIKFVDPHRGRLIKV